MLRTSSSTSRVVPGTGVTMARSDFSRAFNRLDLPTFGRPIIAAVTPSRSIRPCWALSTRRAISARVSWGPAGGFLGWGKSDVPSREAEGPSAMRGAHDDDQRFVNGATGVSRRRRVKNVGLVEGMTLHRNERTAGPETDKP